MSTVADVAAEVGRSTAEVLGACRALGIVASGSASGLSAEEHRRLRDALGASDLPPPVRGSTSERPAPRPPRRPADAAAVKRRVSPRTVTRIGLGVFLVVAVVVSVVSLRGGDDAADACVDLADGGPVQVPCEEPHDAEVVGMLELPDGTFPGEDGVRAAAEGPCRAAREQRVTARHRERLELVLLVPTGESWGRGDRTVTCLVEGPDGPLVGPVAGSGG